MLGIKPKRILLNASRFFSFTLFRIRSPIVSAFHHKVQVVPGGFRALHLVANIPIGAKPLSSLFAIGMTIIFCGLGWAMNSLVSPDDVTRMKQAKIGDTVIQMLIAEQTCSVTGEFLMKLKRAGADDEMLKAVILADRYKNPRKAELSPEQIGMLKKAGFSDEMIMQMINSTPVKRVTDDHGNESVVHGARRAPEAETPPPAESQGIYNINIEKVEQP
jgi:hypothetical protein